MALVVKDRVRVVSTTTGTSDFALGSAVTGYQSFSVIGDGNQTYYAAQDSSTGDWEVGIGTYSSTGPTLSRDTILESSNSNAKVPFGAGPKDVFCTYPAERSVYLDVAGSAVTVLDIGTLGTSVANISTANITAGTVSTAPANSNDLVNKSYVDGIAAQGISYHTPVKYEVPNTTGNLNAIYNQPGGPTSGVGATLTNNGTLAAFAPDGPTAAPGDRILVYNQTNAYENGVYTVTTVGSGSVAWVLTRATDADQYGVKDPNKIGGGDAFYVTSGNTGAGETYVCNNAGAIVFGTTAITFAQVSSAQVYSAGTGLTLTNTTFSITNTGVTAATYGGAATVPVIAVNDQGQITSATNTAISIAAGSVTGLAASATTDTTNAANITSGTLNSSRLSGAYTGITQVGTLTAGTWNATVIAASYGGTGLSSYAVGDLIYADTTTSLAKLPDVVTGNVLISGGVGTAPAWGKVGLTTHVSGTLAVANGGTGATTLTGYVKGNGTGAFTAAASIPNADTTATSANTANTIVLRNASGNFSAGIITAALTGNASSATTATTATTATNLAGGVAGALPYQSSPANTAFTAAGTSGQYLKSNGTSAPTWDNLPAVNNGTLSMGVSGTGLSGSATFTANQSGNSTFTVTSNATSLNTANAIVARDGSGNFSAGTITATLTGIATRVSGYSLPNTGGTASWIHLGTWSSTGQDGAKIGLQVYSASGYSANINQNQLLDIYFKVSNGSSSQVGSTGAFYGDGVVFDYGVAAAPTIRVIQVSTSEYQFWASFGSLTGNNSFYNAYGVNGTWTNVATSGTPSGNYIDLPARVLINSSNYTSYVNNGTLTMGVSGNGLTGSATFTANQVGASSFTVSSNATSVNTASTIVFRDASGNFAAGTITATLNGNASTATFATSATTANTATTATNLAGGAIGSIPYQSAAGTTAMLASGTAGSYLRANGSAAPSWVAFPTIGNGTLTMGVSGNGLSGSATFTANQTGASTFTVTSNATAANTASTIVYRDASGNFSAGDINANSAKIGNWTGGSTYKGLFHASMTGNEYMVTNGGTTDGNTYLSAFTGKEVVIRGGNNVATFELRVPGSSRPSVSGNTILDAGNYNSYSPTLTGGGASGSWGINITGNAATATSATTANTANSATTASQIDSIEFRNGNSTNAVGPDSITDNGTGYVNTVSLFGQTDGALYSQAYSSSWVHQIFGDYRTGQIAILGRNSGTWQAWRSVLDSTNYTSYVGNGTLTMSVSGNGLSGSATFTANQSGNSTFTVSSNATSANTASTIVFRDASGGTAVGNLNNNTWYNYNDNDRNAGSSTYYPNASTRAVRYAFVTASSVGTGGNYAGLLQFNPWDGTTASTNDASYQLAFGSTAANGGGDPQLRLRKGIDTTWNAWVDILTSVNYTSYVGNGTLTMGVAGNGLTGSATFTANQSGASTFTVTSNATNANTANTIVFRDASGNFSAGTITASLSGNASTATSATSAGSSTNLAGGALGSIPYQSASGTTAFLAAGTAGQVIRANGAAAPSWVNGTISGVSLGNNLNTLTMNTSGNGISGSATYNGSGAATYTVSSNATNANTASTIVFRDASGNFSAGTVTAALSGNATTATTWQTARTLTIGSTGKSVNGSGNVAWTISEIGALPSNTTPLIVGPLNTATEITSQGTGNLLLSTNSGTNSGYLGITAGANNEVYAQPNGTGRFAITTFNSSLNTVQNMLRFNRQVLGTPAVGIGVGIQFDVETSVSNTETGAVIEAVTTDVTAASEDFDFVFKLMTEGATALEVFRLKSTGFAVGQNLQLTGGVQAISYNGGQQAGFRNKIINGKMDIAQRGTTFTSPASGAYTLDRFQWSATTSAAVTITQNTDVPGGDRTLQYSLRVAVTTADTSIASTDFAAIIQSIEGYNVQNLIAVPAMTLSFWVRSSKTGTHCVALRNSGAGTSYVMTYQISTANTWERKFLTISGGINTTFGTWNFTNGLGLSVAWILAAGTNFHTTANTWVSGNFLSTAAQVNCLDLNTNIFAITGVQLETGEVPTTFEYRDIATELAMCKRYYASVAYTALWGFNTTQIYGPPIAFKSTMRTVPTITLPTSTNQAYTTAGAQTTPTVWTTTGITVDAFSIRVEGAVALGGYIGNTATASSEF